MKKKLIRVIFEYEDGSKRILFDNAQRWIEAVDYVCMLADEYGRNIDWREFKWEDMNE